MKRCKQKRAQECAKRSLGMFLLVRELRAMSDDMHEWYDELYMTGFMQYYEGLQMPQVWV